jgi:hypothetical protein
MTPCFVAVTLAGLLASGKPAKDAKAYPFISVRGGLARLDPAGSVADLAR